MNRPIMQYLYCPSCNGSLIAIVVLLALLAGCATAPVNSDYRKDISYRTWRNFDWFPEDLNPAPATMDNRMDARIKSALRQELMARAYRQQFTGLPDFWINYRLGPITHRVKDHRTPEPETLGPMEIWDPLDIPELGPSGLMLEIIEPATRHVVWRAWEDQAILADLPLGPKGTKKINQAVRALLLAFPPR